MTAVNSAVINELNKKIEQLIKQYILSLDKNKNLEEEINKLKIQIKGMKDENSVLNEEIKNLKVANAISQGEGNKEAKGRISQLVREIDKCIALLND